MFIIKLFVLTGIKYCILNKKLVWLDWFKREELAEGGLPEQAQAAASMAAGSLIGHDSRNHDDKRSQCCSVVQWGHFLRHPCLVRKQVPVPKLIKIPPVISCTSCDAILMRFSVQICWCKMLVFHHEIFYTHTKSDETLPCDFIEQTPGILELAWVFAFLWVILP